ncbi:MAG: glycerol-3-phosphate acyltransferase [Clostridia bacterium]|nr:glycerol-3-phosphate acyltransferase [Clostridia bacterium]
MKELQPAYCWYFLLIAVVCYFIGCFNFAVILSKFKKDDIRKEGSGNPGTMNMTRTFGAKWGAITLACDVIKGGLPALIGWIIFRNYVFAGTDILVGDFVRYLCGVCVIIGHVFPVTMKFHGGKGIASTWGMFLFALPCDTWWYFFIALVLLVLAALYVVFFKYGSTGSLLGVAAMSIFQAVVFILRYTEELTSGWVIAMLLMILIINLITWLAHHQNLWQLCAGEEHKTIITSHGSEGQKEKERQEAAKQQ